jgi:hypothetical protein
MLARDPHASGNSTPVRRSYPGIKCMLGLAAIHLRAQKMRVRKPEVDATVIEPSEPMIKASPNQPRSRDIYSTPSQFYSKFTAISSCLNHRTRYFPIRVDPANL